MPVSQSWRRPVVAAILLATLAFSLTVARGALPGADAQEPPPTSTGVISGLPVLATNGFSNLPEFSGSGDGVLGVACTGASPLGGSANVPAQVVTELRTDLTYLRILRTNGTAITGTVRINCVLEVDATPEGASSLQRLQDAAEAAR
jgi:hypothetical protein